MLKTLRPLVSAIGAWSVLLAPVNALASQVGSAGGGPGGSAGVSAAVGAGAGDGSGVVHGGSVKTGFWGGGDAFGVPFMAVNGGGSGSWYDDVLAGIAELPAEEQGAVLDWVSFQVEVRSALWNEPAGDPADVSEPTFFYSFDAAGSNESTWSFVSHHGESLELAVQEAGAFIEQHEPAEDLELLGLQIASGMLTSDVQDSRSIGATALRMDFLEVSSGDVRSGVMLIGGWSPYEPLLSDVLDWLAAPTLVLDISPVSAGPVTSVGGDAMGGGSIVVAPGSQSIGPPAQPVPNNCVAQAAALFDLGMRNARDRHAQCREDAAKLLALTMTGPCYRWKILMGFCIVGPNPKCGWSAMKYGLCLLAAIGKFARDVCQCQNRLRSDCMDARQRHLFILTGCGVCRPLVDNPDPGWEDYIICDPGTVFPDCPGGCPG